MTVSKSPLDLLPPPPSIHERMGCLYRELALLRRLLRLSQAAREERHAPHADLPSASRQEVAR